MNQIEQSLRKAALQKAEIVRSELRFLLAVKWLIKSVIETKRLSLYIQTKITKIIKRFKLFVNKGQINRKNTIQNRTKRVIPRKWTWLGIRNIVKNHQGQG